MTKYAEVSIQPASGGFGEYECNLGESGDKWASLFDLELEIGQSSGAEESYKLGNNAPDSIDDIRGRIHNEPDHVYAHMFSDGTVIYSGVIEVEG